MKIIIAGSRTIINKEAINKAINRGMNKIVPSDKRHEITVISGGARGVDLAGEDWAKIFEYPCRRYNANWNRYGKRAGYLRNVEMANNADALIIIWDGVSKGTKHMMDIANEKKLPVYMEIINEK